MQTNQTTESIPRRRALATRQRGMYPKQRGVSEKPRKNAALPTYLTKPEVDVLLGRAPHASARLLMLTQWRAGLRVAEALNLEPRDVDGDDATIRVRGGKGGRDRIVPCHSELAAAFRMFLDYTPMRRDDKFWSVSPRTALRWVKQAYADGVASGALRAGANVGTHTLRHSYARHLLLHGVTLNYLQRWMGHRRMETTLLYLELLPDPTGSMAGIP